MFDGKSFLLNEFRERRSRNPRYSLRAFARAVGISHTVLSLLFNEKRTLSKKAYVRVMEQLPLSEDEKTRHLEEFMRQKKRKLKEE